MCIFQFKTCKIHKNKSHKYLEHRSDIFIRETDSNSCQTQEITKNQAYKYDLKFLVCSNRALSSKKSMAWLETDLNLGNQTAASIDFQNPVNGHIVHTLYNKKQSESVISLETRTNSDTCTKPDTELLTNYKIDPNIHNSTVCLSGFHLPPINLKF